MDKGDERLAFKGYIIAINSGCYNPEAQNLSGILPYFFKKKI